MAKALRTAALVVGGVALAATGVGALAGLGVAVGVSSATLTSITAIAGATPGGVMLKAAGVRAPR